MQVVIDTDVKQSYQGEPGRQEWVTVMDCICADGSSISPLIIFKGENLSKSWLPKELPEGWHISKESTRRILKEDGVEQVFTQWIHRRCSTSYLNRQFSDQTPLPRNLKRQALSKTFSSKVPQLMPTLYIQQIQH